MAPTMTPLLMLPLAAYVIFRRVRTQFGLQPINPSRMIFRIAFLAIFAALSFWFAGQGDIRLLQGLLGGIAGGAVIGLIALKLTRFTVDPVKGDCYVPNPYIGATLSLLFLARLIWRYTMVLPQMQDPTGATPPVHGPDFGQSPLTLFIFGLLVGYYICYLAACWCITAGLCRGAAPTFNKVRDGLKRVVIQFAGADSDHLLQAADENLAIANLAGASGLGNCFDHPVKLVVHHCHFDLDLRQEIHHVLGAPVQLVWPFCRPKPFTSVTVMPCTPTSASASRTSSSLNGLMTATTNFMDFPCRVASLSGGRPDEWLHRAPFCPAGTGLSPSCRKMPTQTDGVR